MQPLTTADVARRAPPAWGGMTVTRREMAGTDCPGKDVYSVFCGVARASGCTRSAVMRLRVRRSTRKRKP